MINENISLKQKVNLGVDQYSYKSMNNKYNYSYKSAITIFIFHTHIGVQ